MARVDSELQGVREINALFQRPQGQEHEVSSASYAHRVSSFERDLEMMEQRVSSFVRCALPPPPLASLSLSLSLSRFLPPRPRTLLFSPSYWCWPAGTMTWSQTGASAATQQERGGEEEEKEKKKLPSGRVGSPERVRSAPPNSYRPRSRGRGRVRWGGWVRQRQQRWARPGRDGRTARAWMNW